MHDKYPESRKKLYKIPAEGKICGVCAGLAEYFGMETWVIRLIVLSMLLFSFGLFNGPVFIAYWVLCFVLDPKPGSEKEHGFGSKCRRQQDAEDERPYRPSVREVWKKSTSPGEILDEVGQKFESIESRLQEMERYVTGKAYKLDKAIRAVK